MLSILQSAIVILCSVFQNKNSNCNRLESVILLKVCKISAVQIIEEIFINYQRTLISKQKDESGSRKEMRERT